MSGIPFRLVLHFAVPKKDEVIFIVNLLPPKTSRPLLEHYISDIQELIIMY